MKNTIIAGLLMVIVALLVWTYHVESLVHNKATTIFFSPDNESPCRPVKEIEFKQHEQLLPNPDVIPDNPVFDGLPANINEAPFNDTPLFSGMKDTVLVKKAKSIKRK